MKSGKKNTRFLPEHEGSAYLFVCGIILVTSLILSFSLKRTTQSRQTLFNVQAHLKAKNNLDSCTALLFHAIKQFHAENDGEFAAETGELKLSETGLCSFELREGYYLQYEFMITAQEGEIQKKALITMKGTEGYDRISWEMINTKNDLTTITNE
jgi:hypothetical protein